MPLRFNTLPALPQIRNLHRKVLFFILLSLAYSSFAQTDDVKKQALKHFEEEDYEKAYKLYSQLVANYPKDPEYNYRLGVCMIYAEPDKKKCLPFLKLANSKPEEAPKETKFYLGKAYHINYLFDEAIKYYNEYKKIGSASQQKKLQVEREIKACVYGKRLLSNLSDLVIQSKKTLNEADYFRSYDLKDIGGKLLVKPDDFKTSADKKKKDKSIVYLPSSGNRVYFSSYGEGDNKDIYYATKLPNGTFSPPQKVTGINSEFDEDFPFLHPNGTTMYFASKGFNSMGGYDIFKSTYIEETNSWSQPVNLEFPINSPDDDYLYVTDSLEKTAFFSTGRQSLPGKIDVLKISTERKPIDVLALKGTVLKENANQSLKSKITVKNMDNGNIVGIFEAEDNGDYLMDLPNGANLLYTVETPGLKTQSERVGLPMVGTSKPLKQSISYDNGILKILNYFDETATDDSYLQYLKIIEKKAKLDVNQGQNNLSPTLIGVVPGEKKNNTNTGTGNDNSTGNPTVVDNQASSTNTTASANKAGMDNKQLADIAKKEAEELNKEANKLLQDADDAKELANTKRIEADKKIKEADEAFKNAEAITNEEEKKTALEKANLVKNDAENDKAVATKLDSYADALNEDARVKIKESELNKQYSDELAKAIATKDNSKTTLDKLDNIQSQIDAVAGYKNKSDEIYNAIKNDAEEKEKEVSKAEKNAEDIKTNIQEIREAISSNEADLAKAKRKEKAGIQAKIDELKTEQTEKEKQLESADAEIKKLKEGLDGATKSSDLVARVKNETIATNTKTVSLTPSTTTTSIATAGKITNKTLSDKYKDRIAITDNTSKDNIENSSTELKNYNSELDVAISKNKNDLSKTNNPNTKQQLSNEIKLMEAAKKQNDQKIAANTKKLDDLNRAAIAANKNEPLTPITSTDNTDAINKLDKLDNKLNINDKANFDFNGYQNTEAQKLKVEADAKLNESEAQQKKLKELVSNTKNQLKSNSGGNGNPVSAQQLYKDAEDLSLKAFDLRSLANTKTGTEKDALINEAKALEAQANEKNLQAAEINKKDNKTAFDTEVENLNALIADNKANETDIADAKKLSEEAALAYKQANSIREEANSQTNASAKLGNLSNAEEKETEAIAKQKQAVDLLKTSSPGITLKKAATSSQGTTTNTGNPPNLDTQLSDVNNGVNELLSTRTNAYEKLYEANKLELDQLTNDLKNNQDIIDKTPAFKTEYISATNKVNAANNALQTVASGTDNNKKINDLAEITKKQTEALNQLNNLAKKVNATAATTARNGNNTNNGNDNSNVNSNNNTNGVNTNTATNTTVNTSSVNANNTDNSTATNTNTTPVTNTDNTNNSGNNTAVNTTTQNSNNNRNATTASTIDIQGLGSKDTTPSQLLTLFETKKPNLNNQQANALVNKSIADLKNIENEMKALDDGTGNNGNKGSASELKTKADNLLVEAEDLSVKAFDTRTLANSKTGAEKDDLLAKAKDLDDQSQNKKLEAVQLTEKSNEISYTTNTTAIDELLLKLKTDDPDLASQLTDKNSEIAALKNQAKQLREEANAQTNTNARIGSMMNAEEKESEMLQKQNDILNELKKRYPDYVVKENSATANATAPGDIAQKKIQLAEKQNEQLTNLTNAFSLEYETSKNNVAPNLNNNQKAVKKNAEDLNAESKRLLIQSANEKNPNEKVKLLALAAKSGNAAVDLLNSLPKSTNAVANNNPRTNRGNNNNTNPGNNTNRTNGNNAGNNTNRTNNTTTNNTAGNTNTNAGARTLKVEGLEVTAGNAYSAGNPIPVDSKVPDGLVFRVQIGAFKSRLPDNSFRGLSPVNGETAPNGYIRYTAGNFNKLENANAVKNDLKNLGYSDAFVVVFYNGKRISLNEALDIMAKEGKTVDNNAPLTVGIGVNTNIPKATTIVTPNINTQDAVTVTKELEQTNDLLYTVQIGVYNKQVNKGKLFNLKPIYTEKLPNGLYRYTAGIYNDPGKLLTDKGKVVGIGIKDAFVSAYFNGKRISFADGKTKQQDSTTRMEPENPIIFSDVVLPNTNTPVNNAPVTNTPVNNTPANTTTVQPFSNGVTSYPAATAENGVKATEEGVCFKVQIGAYSKQVPADVAAKFLSIKTWPVENKQINGLFIYNIGNFSDAKFAKTLKTEAVVSGINDAFITVYRDGKKLYGADAAQYLNR